MIKYLIPFFFLLTACNSNSAKESNEDDGNQAEKPITTENNAHQEDTLISAEKSFSYLITFEEATGFGYQILENDHLLINQVHIPAVPGIKGFSNKEKAETTALYILDQVEKGNFPPTITQEKLKELDVL